jgi:hypothetical protein
MMPSSPLLEVLASARQIASHAVGLGISARAMPSRPAVDHIGAVLADCILQAGLNYRTVVRPRVKRIQANYPSAARLSGVKAIVDGGEASDFLCWKHAEKLSRFSGLVALLGADSVEEVSDLREWLNQTRARERFLSLHGIGPKTYDYVCCLVGIDRIAVDRHVKSFASEAGVTIRGYDELQVVVSYAADLLGLRRREFDAWIWRLRAQDAPEARQRDLFEPGAAG